MHHRFPSGIPVRFQWSGREFAGRLQASSQANAKAARRSAGGTRPPEPRCTKPRQRWRWLAGCPGEHAPARLLPGGGRRRALALAASSRASAAPPARVMPGFGQSRASRSCIQNPPCYSRGDFGALSYPLYVVHFRNSSPSAFLPVFGLCTGPRPLGSWLSPSASHCHGWSTRHPPFPGFTFANFHARWRGFLKERL